MTTASYILVVVTYLFGSTQGPVVSTEILPTAAQCEIARKAVIDTVDQASASLPSTSRTGDGVNFHKRKVVTANCKPLT